MIEIAFFIAMLGSLVAGLWDLKTTEIPDEIPTLMAFLGIFIWFINTLTTGNIFPLIFSVVVGTIYLLIGWTFYKTGQWGGGDAKLLAGIGYLVPFFPGVFLFPFTFFVNVFLVGAAWVILYALVIGLTNKKVISVFKKDVKKKWKRILLLPIFVLVLILFIMHYTLFFNYLILFTLFVGVLFLVIFIEFARIVERIAFRKTIPVRELKPGDVLEDSKIWEGLTEEEVEKLKRMKKEVTIKEGVRFGPVFAIALFLTVFYGNILFLPLVI